MSTWDPTDVQYAFRLPAPLASCLRPNVYFFRSRSSEELAKRWSNACKIRWMQTYAVRPHAEARAHHDLERFLASKIAGPYLYRADRSLWLSTEYLGLSQSLHVCRWMTLTQTRQPPLPPARFPSTLVSPRHPQSVSLQRFSPQCGSVGHLTFQCRNHIQPVDAGAPMQVRARSRTAAVGRTIRPPPLDKS